MPIQLKCPNGHHLTAKESNAGKTGKCPVCKSAVVIPAIHQTVITDSAVISILGETSAVKRVRNASSKRSVAPPPVQKPNSGTPPILESELESGSVIPPPVQRTGSSISSSSILPHIRLCPSCEREIDLGYHICPHCHTYITVLNDF